MAKFKLGSTKDEESVNVSSNPVRKFHKTYNRMYKNIVHCQSQAKQRQHADIRLKYIMAQAKQKFLTLLCKEDILHGKESVEKFGTLHKYLALVTDIHCVHSLQMFETYHVRQNQRCRKHSFSTGRHHNNNSRLHRNQMTKRLNSETVVSFNTVIDNIMRTRATASRGGIVDFAKTN